VGVALAIVLVQVTANVTSDEFATTTATSSTTTTTTAAPRNGLEVALSTSSSFASCGSFEPGPLAFGGFTFALNTGAVSPTQFLCVQNGAGSGITGITFAPVITTSGEDGCSADEAAVDPDGAGCGSSGELTDILGFNLTRTDSNGTGSSSCFNYGGALVAPGGSLPLLGSPLGPAGICVYRVDLVFSGSPTYEQKLAASTDTAGYTIDVTASP
jgi:hypothetical protein